jgi:VWFA-related protein
MRRTSSCLLVLMFTAAGASSQSQQPLRSTTAGVLMDVAVLDRDGRPVLDLALEDFELREGGTRQRILSALLVQGGTVRPVGSRAGAATAAAGSQAAAGTQEPTAPPADPPRVTATASVTAILFDRLTAEVRPLARQAALAFVSTLGGEHDYAGVFLADTKLMTFGPFTNQQAPLREAIDRASSVITARPGPLQATAQTGGLPIDPAQPVTAGAESGSGWINAREREKALNAGGAEGALRRMELRMIETFRQLMTEYEGQTSVAGLRAVVDALGPLPGRKSIMYFGETLPVTDRLRPRVDALIDHANQRNITIYPVDAAGLRVHSAEAEVGRYADVAGAQTVGDAKRDSGGWTKELERQEQMLVSRPTAVFGRLAKETGGFLVENTNNLTAGVGRMQHERSTYYLLAYQPTNAAADGTFRRVEVKVKRPRVMVRSRPGYKALPPPR